MEKVFDSKYVIVGQPVSPGPLVASKPFRYKAVFVLEYVSATNLL